MYEDFTRQSLPSVKYRELLGTAICVFNSNNQFIIENILLVNSSSYDWYDLTDRTSGQLACPIKTTITEKSDTDIANLFADLVVQRNRIIHSFQITKNDEQILHTKDKNHRQFTIEEGYIVNFIKLNEKLSGLLHKFRGY